ncbi:hypothetical protein [Paenibacillus sp.]|uniref:hypothetical protein n=1 Tax=Paenibacillus sp. TaxID=58172 RepID=UPI002D4AA5A9|nr:hypothetical protein [Paenibacillus sp.]HZG55625.1 hypothetical protein [Paenibacillus sp.]
MKHAGLLFTVFLLIFSGCSVSASVTASSTVNDFYRYVENKDKYKTADREEKVVFESYITSFNSGVDQFERIDGEKFQIYTVIIGHQVQGIIDQGEKKLASVKVWFEDRSLKDPNLIISGTAIHEVILSLSENGKWVVESVLEKDKKFSPVKPKNEFQTH